VETAVITDAAPVDVAPPTVVLTDADLRAELAAAIAAKAAAEDALANQREAIGRAEELAEKARERLEAAEAAVETAKADHAAAIARSVGDGTAPATSGVKKARADVADTADEVDAAISAIATLREQMTEFEDDVAKAGFETIRARAALVAAVLEPMLERTTAARAAFWRDEMILRALLFGTPTAEPELSKSRAIEQLRLSQAAKAPIAPLRADFEDFLAQIRVLDGPPIGIWQRWYRALLVDPEAPEPGDG
jgi:hypothetical protein